MILTVQIKLLPTPEQSQALQKTLETVNAACNRLSEMAWNKKEFRQFPLQKLFYRQIRSEFPLSAQVTVRLIAKVSDSYKLDQDAQRTFRKYGAISYDGRILTFSPTGDTLNIWTINGRAKMSFVCGEKQRKLLELSKGESRLILRNGQWFLFVSVDVPDALEQEAIGWLGIDLGLVNIAQDSDGKTYGNSPKILSIRNRRFRQRKRLQSKRTRSANRVLHRISGREGRFVKQANHEIAKQIVTEAKRTKRGIALEDLKHIRSRIRANRKQRRILHSWTFADLQAKIAYKSRLIGVRVKFIDPRNTSRTCPACGCIDKKNRKTRDLFECISCGFTDNADTVGAENIRVAAIDRPNERKGVRVHAQ